jgi:hypothetical protein
MIGEIGEVRAHRARALHLCLDADFHCAKQRLERPNECLELWLMAGWRWTPPGRKRAWCRRALGILIRS